MNTTNKQAMWNALQKAISIRNTIKKGNITEFIRTLNSQPSFSSSATTSTQCAPPNPSFLQYVEVLTTNEKQDTLLDLMRHILSLNSFKNIKIIIFVREFTILKIKQFEDLLYDEMAKVKGKFPGLDRLYAYCQGDEATIERSLKKFSELANGVLITDVNCRSLGTILLNLINNSILIMLFIHFF
jgi:hypothetical protein